LQIRTDAREQLVDVTRQVSGALEELAVADAIVTLFVPHTTAAVTVNENWDPDVQSDMLAWLHRMIPPDVSFRHSERNSDAHLKASLVGPSLQVPVAGGRLQLGQWQGVYFCEFDGPRMRDLHLYAP
jgi:secondary thiamine-phosphate synthase enzyme